MRLALALCSAGNAERVALAGLSVTTGSLVGGTTVVITGTGFVTGATVAIGGVACTNVSVDSSTQITCKTGAAPYANLGSANAVVTNNPSGASGSLSNAFTYTFSVTDRGASLVHWLYVGAGVVLNGSNVSSLADQSGSGDANRNAVQATVSKQPAYLAGDAQFNGRPSLHSQDSTRQLSTGIWSASYKPVTVYSVGLVPTNGGVLLGGDAGGSAVEMFRQTGNISAFAGAIINSGISYATAHVACAVFNGASSALYVDASQTPQVSGNAGANVLDRLGLLALRNSTGVANTYFVEEIAINAADSSVSRSQLMGYLGNKYGIAVS